MAIAGQPVDANVRASRGLHLGSLRSLDGASPVSTRVVPLAGRCDILWAMRVVFLVLALLCGTAAAQQPDADRLLKTAMEAQQRGDFRAAIHDYRAVLKLRPNMVEAEVNLGAALAHVGQYDEAIAMYRRALPSVTPKMPVLMNLALAYYKKGDFAHAREQFESLHKAAPDDVRIAILLGESYTHSGNPADAVKLLAPMEGTNSSNLDFEYALGSALIGSGDRRQGAARMEKVGAAGKSADAYMVAGTALLQVNEFEQARHDLDAALQIEPNLPGLYTLAGTARDKCDDPKTAEPAFREALKLNPNDFQANLYLGTILYKRREMDEAKIYLDRALKLKPRDPLARYEAAMLKSTSGDYEAAAAELESLAKDDPDWLEPHVELASLYYRLHRPQDGARERQIVGRLTAEQAAKKPPTQPSK